MSYCKKILFTVTVLTVTLVLLTSCNKKAPDETMQAVETPESITAITTVTNLSATEPPTTFASISGTDTLTVDGVLYRNNFQSKMTLSSDYYNSLEEIQSSDKYLYRVKDAPFDIIYDPDPLITRDIAVSDVIYCRDDQWQELHAYYANPDNYDYSYIAVDEYRNLDRHTINNPDREKFDELVVWFEENSFNLINGITNPQLSYPVLNDEHFIKYRFIVETKDKIFSKGAGEFYVQNSKLSLIYTQTMLTSTTLVIDVPDNLANYFISLISQI
ncbi:MAG: hypothetical protein ACI4SB_01880 [Acutalibacteraceae bacterium]